MLQSPWVQMYDPYGNVFLSALVAEQFSWPLVSGRD